MAGKDFKTIDEQLDILRSRGLLVEDEEKATFSIYQILPELIELWGMNIKTTVPARKTEKDRAADVWSLG